MSEGRRYQELANELYFSLEALLDLATTVCTAHRKRKTRNKVTPQLHFT